MKDDFFNEPSLTDMAKEVTSAIINPTTTCEWTVDWLCERAGMSALTREQARLICDAHNASIDAEKNLRADWNYVIEELEKQLAAERAKVIRLEGEFAIMYQNELKLAKERDQLREQLAAAQAAMRDILALDTDVPSLFQAKQICLKALKGDTTALDAAIAEATKPLVGALKRIAKGTTCYTTSGIAEAALAQVKEGTFQNQPKEPSEKQQQ